MRNVPALVANVGRTLCKLSRFDRNVLALPFANLGVTVGEAEAACLIMIKGRNVAPLAAVADVRVLTGAAAGSERANKESVVDAARMFVNEDIHVRWLLDVAGSLPLAPGRAVTPAGGKTAGRITGIAAPPIGIHGDTTEALVPFGVFLNGGEIFVGRALVDGDVALEVFVERRIQDILHVRVVRRQAPIDNVVDPVVEALR